MIWTPKLIKPPLGTPIKKGHPLAKGRVGHWLAYPGTTALDVSGNRNHGTLIANTHLVPGKFGHAWDFDGTGDYVEIADSPVFTLTNGFTIILWAKADSYASDERVVVNQWGSGGAGNAAWLFRVNTSGYLQIYTHDGADTGSLSDDTTSIGTTSWRQLAVSFSGGTTGVNARLYVDGRQVKSGTLDVVPQDSAYNVVIGAKSNDKSDEFDGQIDNVKIYNWALTASAVAWAYRQPFAMFERPSSIALLSYAEAAGEGIAILRRRRVG